VVDACVVPAVAGRQGNPSAMDLDGRGKMVEVEVDTVA
jgi:hypothetical protein